MRLDESLAGLLPLREAPSAAADYRPPRPASRAAETRRLVAQIDRRLALLIGPETRDPLDVAIRHALLAPGKRIRPLLTMLTAREVGLDAGKVLDLGCAIEMLHAASLVLDDLPAMDNAEIRRGRASTHAAHGEDMAILASVTLLSRAFSVVAESAAVPFDKRARLVSLLAEAVGPQGLSGGQSRDLRAQGLDRESLADANHLKTGALFIAAVEAPCLLIDASRSRLLSFRRFASHLGQAFQLADDLFDGGTTDSAGEDGDKATLVSALGRDEAIRMLELHLSRALGEVEHSGDLARFATELFAKHRGAGQTVEIAPAS